MKFGEIKRGNKFKAKYSILDDLNIDDSVDVILEDDDLDLAFEKVRAGAYRHGLKTNKFFRCSLNRKNRVITVYRVNDPPDYSAKIKA